MKKPAKSVVALCLAACASSGAAPAAADRPNIVLVMCDDLGWGDPAYMGNKDIHTPHLDAMAAAGIRFNRFYAAAPVCSPTRGSCMTGRHPYRYGVFSANVGHMRPQELTLAELLKKLGYATGHFGKWHLGTLTRTLKESNRGGPKGIAHYSPPWDNGFEECFSTEAKVPTWDPMLRPRTAKGGRWWDPVTDAADAVPYGTHYWANGALVKEDLRGDDSKLIMDRALPFIEASARAKKPFFTVIWFHAPHLPVVAGPEHTKRYSAHDKYTRHYYGCITALDEQVGRLRKTLRDLGVAKETLVWFASDNGPEGKAGKAPGSAGILRGRKRDLFEGGVRVPGILEWPSRIPSARSTDLPASSSDYLPTILDVLGVERPDARPLDGISLLPLIEGRMEQRPEPIGFQSRNQLALTGNRWKLISRDRGKTWMLFDLIEDPSEKTDLSRKHPDRVRTMAAALKAWTESCSRSLEGKDYP